MITAKRIKELLTARPFVPFRVYLSDGSMHEVPHPEFAWVFGGSLFVGKQGNGTKGGEGEWVTELAILHVSRIETESHSTAS